MNKGADAGYEEGCPARGETQQTVKQKNKRRKKGSTIGAEHDFQDETVNSGSSQKFGGK